MTYIFKQITNKKFLEREYSTHLRDTFGSALEYSMTPKSKVLCRGVLDSIVIRCQGGRGGDGGLEYKKHPNQYSYGPGKPAGGCGGRGGHIILKTNSIFSGFEHTIPYIEANEKRHYRLRRGVYRLTAPNGTRGLGKHQNGVPGDDIYLQIPNGTIVDKISQFEKLDGGAALQQHNHQSDQKREHSFSTTESSPNEILQTYEARQRHFGKKLYAIDHPIIEEEQEESEDEDNFFNKKKIVRGYERVIVMSQPDQEFIVCHGGNGGNGNSTELPHTCFPGQSGETLFIRLRLECLAEVGLVGYPNAGKSSLFAALTNARPKIDPEPFTTLVPSLGMIKFNDVPETSVSVADLPGLIDGAHLNCGCGFKFLHHIEKTRILCLIIDMSNQNKDPQESFLNLRQELKLFSRKNLYRKPFFVVANKCDVKPNETLPKVRQCYPEVKVIPVRHQFINSFQSHQTSARFGDGIERVVQEIRRLVKLRS